MFAIAEGPSFVGSPLNWNLLFARQPEPDLEFTEEELEQTTTVRSPSPMKPPKKSNGRPLLWVLLLIVIGGGAYVAMEPDMLMEYIGPLLGESQEPQPQPPVAHKPVAQKPTPPIQATVPQAAAPAEVPQAAAPAPAPVPAPPVSQPEPTASAPVEAPSSVAAVPAAPITASPTPLFGEGQRVSVLANPVNPKDKVLLAQDAEGTRPGPAIPPGTALTILDGDLQAGGWVYSVRSDFGTKGWLAEKQLRLKP